MPSAVVENRNSKVSTNQRVETCLPILPVSRDRKGAGHQLHNSHSSAATGQLRLLLYIPDRSKQQGRRSPADSFEMATPIRFTRVSARLPEVIQ
jgi:hypothetical protein